MMTANPTDAIARELRADAPEPPGGLGSEVLEFVRGAGRTLAAVPRIDLEATREGVSRIAVGRGRTTAPDRTARRICEHARAELDEFFAGERGFFTVPVDLSSAAPFQRFVLESARAIPLGEVRSYGWIAERIGRPGAVRAVGTALGRKPVPFVVPCHRVVRSDGSLGGYAFGLDLKRHVLLLERGMLGLVGDRAKRVLCRTGCPRERALTEDRRVAFASTADARAAGYAPCPDCRPRDDAEAPPPTRSRSRPG
jgi:O-6-methylguanine DNA methyltransferase